MTVFLSISVVALFFLGIVFVQQLMVASSSGKRIERLKIKLSGQPAALKKQSRSTKDSQIKLRMQNLFVLIGQKIGSVSKLAQHYEKQMLMAGYYKKNASSTFVFSKLSLAVAFPILYWLYKNAADGTTNLLDPFLLVVMVAGFFLPDIFLKNKTIKRHAEISKNWSDVLDIIVISISSGQTIDIALHEAAKNIAPLSNEMARELTVTATELGVLSPRTAAYRRLSDRIPLEFIKNFTFDVIQSEKVGTPLARALQSVAQEHRMHKQQAMEKKAASLGPKLTLPMIMFFFPIIFIVIMTPGFLKL